MKPMHALSVSPFPCLACGGCVICSDTELWRNAHGSWIEVLELSFCPNCGEVMHGQFMADNGARLQGFIPVRGDEAEAPPL